MAWQFLVSVLLLHTVSFVLLPPVSALAASVAVAEVVAPEQYMAQGGDSFQRGAFEEAVRSWREAVRLYGRAQQPAAQSAALTQLAQAYQALGQYQQAIKSFTAALELAEQIGDRTQVATVLGGLGGVHSITGPAQEAQRYLDNGLRLAQEVGNAGLAAAMLNNLGTLLTSQARYDDALVAYTESVQLAQQSGDRALVARALSNAATTALHHGQPQQARAQLDLALEQTLALGQSHDKAYGLINIGLAYDGLRAPLPSANDHLLLQAARAFNAAASVAQPIDDRRAASYALGYLGKLYEDERRYDEALQLTRRAVFAAQQVHTPESLYRWQWQTGRLLKALGDIDAAIAAYQRAVDTLQSFRQEMVLGSSTSQASFRQAVGPVYFGLVDLLLQRAAAFQARPQYEPYLIAARNAVELFKAAELQDYFRDDCVDAARAKATPLDVVAQNAVVIYPILLPDRTELLVSLPEGLKRFTVPVDADTLTQVVRQLRQKLEKRTTWEYLPHAQQLYDWLIRPLEADLTPLRPETLVFVPDGPLRTIPMAALHDGQQFLIAKYAVATTPGLNLTDPRPLQRTSMKVLALGLTDAVQGFPSLPYVSPELEAIQQLYDSAVLRNREFLIPSVEKELQEKAFSIVHIASHGQFASEVEQTFLLTFDAKLTMDRLDQVVGRFRFRDEPLELLTLSACQTAAGDDRAALGLAGVAIKAGARSAIATLWYVNDQGSAELITEFYRQLQDITVSRAVALQRAQLKLLDDQRYEHPGYWSPFLLLNNWL